MKSIRHAFHYSREDVRQIEAMDGEGPTPIGADDMAASERITETETETVSESVTVNG